MSKIVKKKNLKGAGRCRGGCCSSCFLFWGGGMCLWFCFQTTIVVLSRAQVMPKDFFLSTCLPINSRRFFNFFFLEKGIIFQKACIQLLMPWKLKADVKDTGREFRKLPIWLPFTGFILSAYFVTRTAKWKMLIANKIYRGTSSFSH